MSAIAQQNEVLTPESESYIDDVLQANRQRFRFRFDLIARYANPKTVTCLDVGAGGGLFLYLLQQAGATVHGIEPSAARRHFAAKHYGLALDATPLEHSALVEERAGIFDVVSLWDVLEHVNDPVGTIDNCMRLLRPGGLLALDTPIRDAFCYRASEILYTVSAGRVHGFFDRGIYSSETFGHKQIFSSAGLLECMNRWEHEVVVQEKVHELAFPDEYYVRQFVKSDQLARSIAAMFGSLVRACRIRNKMLIVARKTCVAPQGRAQTVPGGSSTLGFMSSRERTRRIHA